MHVWNSIRFHFANTPSSLCYLMLRILRTGDHQIQGPGPRNINRQCQSGRVFHVRELEPGRVVHVGDTTQDLRNDTGAYVRASDLHFCLARFARRAGDHRVINESDHLF